jgi:peptide/nickel transport system permease protein
MIAFIVHRLLQSVIVMTAVAFVALTLFNYVGDPVHNMVGPETAPEVSEQIRIDLGLDQPFYVQFLRFLSNAAISDFGISFRLGSQVGELIKERLPATCELSFTAAVLALAGGIPMGVYTALHRRGWLSNFFLTASLVGVSLPTFVIGIHLHLDLRRRARDPAVLRPRRRRPDRLVDDRLFDHQRPRLADPAGGPPSACSR